MLEPYRMFFINILASIILLSEFLVYRYIYPRKKINLFVLLIFVSLLPLISLLRKGVYESGDFNLHIYRAISFYENLKEGNFMPSWGNELNATYGYPVYIFNYILHYYVIAFFHFLGFSFISSMKFFLALSYVFSGVFMYLWAKNVLRNELAALTASIVYQFMPYHLVVLHYRVNGENFAFMFLPLLLYAVHRLLKSPSVVSSFWTSLIYGLFFYAHSAIAVFSSFIVIPYVILTVVKEEKLRVKKLLYFSLAFTIGLVLANPVFFAHLVLSQYTYGPSLGSEGASYTSFWELLYSPWRYGLLFQGPNGELSFLIGYTQILIVFLSVISIVKQKNREKKWPFQVLWLSLTIFLIYLITPQSSFFWKALPLLSLAQFTYRLLLIVSICIAMLSGYLALHLLKKSWVIYIFLGLTICSTMLNWGNRRTIASITDETLRRQLPGSTASYEGLSLMASPRWLNIDHLWETKTPKNHLEILSGSAEIKDIHRTPTYHSYILSVKNPIMVKENTLFFPGWEVKANNSKVPIMYTDKKYPDKILFSLQKGLNFVEVTYQDMPSYSVSKKISIISFLTILSYIMYIKIKPSSKAKK